MTWIVQNLWLVPVLPILAAGISALAKQRNRRFAASLAIGSMGISFLLSLGAFAHVLWLNSLGQATRQVVNFRWFQFGSEWLKLGWTLAWHGGVSAELIKSTIGLGFLLQMGRELNDAAQVIGIMVLTIIIGVLLDQFVFGLIQKRILLRWGLAQKP